MIGSITSMSLLAAAPPTHSKADLEALLRVAEAETLPLYGRCGSEGGTEPRALAPTIDREAEAGFARVAEIRRLLVSNYPYAKLGRDADKIQSDDVYVAVQQFELAFQCNPGWEQRRYPEAALEMITARREQLVAGGLALPQELVDAETRLRDRLSRLRPEKCPKERPCVTIGPVPPAPETRLGRYKARLMEVLSLRLEFGAGFAADRLYGGSREGTPLVISVAPGVRFLAGRGRRHVFGLGFRYSALPFVGDDRGTVHQVTARFEYGVRAHRQWFSIHAGFEPGFVSHPSSFGVSQLGGVGSLCTWNEALCVRIGGTTTVPYDREAFLKFGHVTFGIDLFRVIENRLTAPEKGP